MARAKREEQKNNLLLKENTISNQKNIISALVILAIIVIVLGLNGLRLNRLLKDLSQTDALSGLYNRRYMNKRLEEEKFFSQNATSNELLVKKIW